MNECLLWLETTRRSVKIFKNVIKKSSEAELEEKEEKSRVVNHV
jgi:hypothetical protein